MKNLVKVYPIALGNHNNVHYKACTSGNVISLRIVVFNITNTAYILKAKTKLHPVFLREDFLLTDIKMRLLDRGINLQDSAIDWDSEYKTEQIIDKYDLYGTV